MIGKISSGLSTKQGGVSFTRGERKREKTSKKRRGDRRGRLCFFFCFLLPLLKPLSSTHTTASVPLSRPSTSISPRVFYLSLHFSPCLFFFRNLFISLSLSLSLTQAPPTEEENHGKGKRTTHALKSLLEGHAADLAEVGDLFLKSLGSTRERGKKGA